MIHSKHSGSVCNLLLNLLQKTLTKDLITPYWGISARLKGVITYSQVDLTPWHATKKGKQSGVVLLIEVLLGVFWSETD